MIDGITLSYPAAIVIAGIFTGVAQYYSKRFASFKELNAMKKQFESRLVEQRDRMDKIIEQSAKVNSEMNARQEVILLQMENNNNAIIRISEEMAKLSKVIYEEVGYIKGLSNGKKKN